MPSEHNGSIDAQLLLAATRRKLFSAAFLSALINILMLTGAFYMLQVYDRVLPSRSVPTLVALSLLMGILYLFQAVLDFIRTRLMSRIAVAFLLQLGESFFRLQFRPTKIGDKASSKPLGELETIKNFTTSPAANALFDLPWIPIYLLVIYLFHPLLGVMALIFALVLICLALLSERLMRPSNSSAAHSNAQLDNLLVTATRNREALNAMAMARPLSKIWDTMKRKQLKNLLVGSDISGGFSSFTRALRMFAQSAILGLGAYLVINEQASPGVIIAGSIVFGRAMAPIDSIIGNWRNLLFAKTAWHNVKACLSQLGSAQASLLELPVPGASLEAQNITLSVGDKVILDDVSFELKAGETLGVIGPSGAGKSSLARILAGFWQADEGRILLDGADISQYGEQIGAYLGVVPQSVELFTGSVSQNIARFDEAAKADDVIAAAQLAGVHELVLGLEEGYNTILNDNGAALSAGQRQRIALARALYGNPFLLILDEPNSNLDQLGEAALGEAVENVAKRGGIVIVITHRAATLENVSKVLMLDNGKLAAFQEKADIISKSASRKRAGAKAAKSSEDKDV